MLGHGAPEVNLGVVTGEEYWWYGVNNPSMSSFSKSGIMIDQTTLCLLDDLSLVYNVIVVDLYEVDYILVLILEDCVEQSGCVKERLCLPGAWSVLCFLGEP
jgi:hypothetical protein